jgi:hypothetical protein
MSKGCVFVHKGTNTVVTVQKWSKSIISADVACAFADRVWSDGIADAGGVDRSNMNSKSFLTLSAGEHP